jgi:hypothetical protein
MNTLIKKSTAVTGFFAVITQIPLIITIKGRLLMKKEVIEEEKLKNSILIMVSDRNTFFFS